MGKFYVKGEIENIHLRCVYVSFTNSKFPDIVFRLRLANEIMTVGQRESLDQSFICGERNVTVKFVNSQRNLEELLEAYMFSHLGRDTIEVEKLSELRLTT